MNKLIRKLLENLFDDYDDIIQNDNDDIERDSIGKKIYDDDIKKKVKEWLRYGIATSPGNKNFFNNIDRDLTFEYIDDILYCNLHFNDYMTVFMSAIPDYIKINKITCKYIKFNSLYNLPKEIDGTMFIDDYKHTKLIGDFPEKIGCLRIQNSKLKSLEGLNDNCVSIESLEIESCNSFQYFMGIPEKVGRISIKECNKLQNIIGLPESVDDIELSDLRNFSSLEGCPKQLNSDLRITNCKKLLSLKYISSLIIGDCSVTYTGIEHLDMAESKTKIIGYFNVCNNKLVDLSNGPEEIKGNYDCAYNPKLTCLNAQDTLMSGYKKTFDCTKNRRLKTLQGLPMMNKEDIFVNTDL